MSTTIDNKEDIFEIAAKAQKLLQEILSSNKTNNTNGRNATLQQNEHTVIKQEPIVQTTPQYVVNQNQNQQFYLNQQQQQQQPQFGYYQSIDNSTYTSPNIPPPPTHQYLLQPPPTQQNLIISPTFYMQHPPPILPTPSTQNAATIVQQPYFYPQQQQSPVRPSYYQAYNTAYHQPPPPIVQMQQQHHHHHYYQQQQQNNSIIPLNTSIPPPNLNSNNASYYRKRKFGELNNFDNNNNINNSRFKTTYQAKATSYFTGANGNTQSITTNSSKSSDLDTLNDSGQVLHEEEDLNLMRERELKELKCKSVVEKMSVFLKYYQQFKDAYIQRVQTIECSDSLKLQFHSLIKYLSEYENLLAELNMLITEHERDHCKNNHRKTKKFFNKTKAFIRYECNKRLQSNIFEYRRLINSQDRYAGMYDLLDMNSYLISLLPDIGVSIRRYINRCEKAREQEQLEDEEDYQQTWYSEENSTDSNELNSGKKSADATDLTIPTFKEYVALNRGEEDEEDEDEEDEDDEEYEDEEDEDNIDDTMKENKKKKRKLSTNESNGTASTSDQPKNSNRAYESFSKGIDTLNRYLLKRVEEEETLDELVKERIVKWINKRQAKYILIFSEVDKLLNQHKGGECYSKFHSYLLFNLGKLVTVCDSYHQKLKELLYSTTIRRKKKRKKVKLLPESMADVFNEIIDLKKALELAKISIKRCNLMNNSVGATSSKEISKQF